MTNHPSLVIFGSVAPGAGRTSATTVQAARVLSSTYKIVICIDDDAPIVSSQTVNALTALGIELVRMRDLHKAPDRYTLSKRLYVMGDSHESLFALRAYEQSPAPILPSAEGLNRLIQYAFATRPGWPESYATYVLDYLGHEGDIIARGLLQHRRISDALCDEMYSVKELKSSTKAAPFFNSEHLLPATGYPILPNRLDTPTGEQEQNEDGLVVAYSSAGCAADAVSSLQALKGAVSTANYVQVCGDDIEMSEKIAAADVVLDLTESTSSCPYVAGAAAAAGKPLVFTKAKWAENFAPYGIGIPHADAVHQTTAALAALITNQSFRQAHQKMAPVERYQAIQKETADMLLEALSASQSPFKQRSCKQASTQELRVIADRPSELSHGAKRSVALIGAVPPKPLIEKIFPQVDWATSPRLATKSIRDTLCADDPTHAANKLAALGYDTPIIAQAADEANESRRAADRIITWPKLRPELLNTQEALSFGCAIEGAVFADEFLADANDVRYSLPLMFSSIASVRPMSNYEEQCGLFWKLNLVEHYAECLLVAGFRGRYKLNSKKSDSDLLISAGHGTYKLAEGESIELVADDKGVLSFRILSLSPISGNIQKCAFLTKTLADCDLNLEWLGHG